MRERERLKRTRGGGGERKRGKDREVQPDEGIILSNENDFEMGKKLEIKVMEWERQ